MKIILSLDSFEKWSMSKYDGHSFRLAIFLPGYTRVNYEFSIGMDKNDEWHVVFEKTVKGYHKRDSEKLFATGIESVELAKVLGLKLIKEYLLNQQGIEEVEIEGYGIQSSNS